MDVGAFSEHPRYWALELERIRISKHPLLGKAMKIHQAHLKNDKLWLQTS